ncbi:MAG: hypothetical protein BGP23_14090 [Lysobacterales bacterium 66-474]|nr:MAG: hypothetical protein ABT18_09920 [Rhodanobacter sp. SCN 66-43]OJY83760.1 MAG: hypothetical protein BGP23_14090 [Xanthomonadales bacterium 66-474]
MWYIIIYSVTTGPAGVLTALAGALIALAIGLVAGVLVGAVAHAIELHVTHRGVLAGDARDGARITLGKLPERAGVQPVAAAPATPESPEAELASAPEQEPVSIIEPTPMQAAPAGADAPSSADHLAATCAEFAREHAGVLVALSVSNGPLVGCIDRASAPDDFDAFLALVSELSSAGVNVSAVQVTQDADGVPTSVTFPVSVIEDEVRQ